MCRPRQERNPNTLSARADLISSFQSAGRNAEAIALLERVVAGQHGPCPGDKPGEVEGHGGTSRVRHALEPALHPVALGTIDLGRATGSSVAGFVTSKIIGAPFLEELILRGCLQSWLFRRFPTPIAIVAAAAAFTAIRAGGAHSHNSVQLGSGGCRRPGLPSIS